MYLISITCYSTVSPLLVVKTKLQSQNVAFLQLLVYIAAMIGIKNSLESRVSWPLALRFFISLVYKILIVGFNYGTAQMQL